MNRLKDEATIRLAGIEYDDTVNGPGLRCVVFLQGCPFHCPGCHNPGTWPTDKGELISQQELYNRIKQDRIATRVTWSGGEATLQYPELLPVVKTLANEGYEQLLFTGYELDELEYKVHHEPEFEVFLSMMTHVIIGRFVLEERSLNTRFRGSKNQRVMKVYSEGGHIYLDDVSDFWDEGDYI